MSRRFLVPLVLAFVSCAHAPPPVRPAGTSLGPVEADPDSSAGAIVGQVTNRATGQPILLVTIVASGPGPGTTSEFSDAKGLYHLGSLPPGRYTLVFIYGDAKITRRDVEVASGKRITVDCRLDVGAREVISIKERAPGIDSGSTKNGTTIMDDYVQELGRYTIDGLNGGATETKARVVLGAPADELWIIARADGPPAGPSAYGSGQLRATPPGEEHEVPLPLEHTDVHARILGYIASVDVKQRFTNPYDTKIEAVYVFPLPANAAVSDFVMTIGQRRIRGIVRERGEAERIYAEARSGGYVASLLTEERPNVFTQKVANIEPRKTIDVALTYYNTLPYENGAYSFAFPMVVGPRYNPAGTTGQATEVTYLAPGETSKHRLSLTVDLDAGVPLGKVVSDSHAIDMKELPGGARRITLKDGETRPNKDLVLRYQVAGEAVRPALFVHKDASGTGTFTLVLEPPAALAQTRRAPVELIFVLDVSGSMAGAPLDRAKGTIQRTLATLGPDDTFNLVLFSSDAWTLFDRPRRATADNLARVVAFLQTTEGGGGTEMLKGMQAALDAARDPERLRLVSFLTDGYIGNEAQILAAIHAKLGVTRIFSFGVGTSVNRYLIERMAIMGRGAAAFVDLNGSSADRAVDAFYQEMSHPALADITVDWNGMKASDVYPQNIPDLLVGRPVVLSGHITGAMPSSITVHGRAGGKPVSYTVPIGKDVVRDHPALAKIWARMRIADLEDRATYEPDVAALTETIKNTALHEGLLSPFTAFIAVDSSAVTQGASGVSVPVAVPVPEGVRYDTTIGATKR